MGWGAENDAFQPSTPDLSTRHQARGSVTLSAIRIAGLVDGAEDKEYTAPPSSSSKKAELAAEDGGDPDDPVKSPNFPKRTFIIEPVFCMIYMFHISSFSLTGQYLYYAFGEKHNLSAILDAERAEMNITGPGDGSRCGSGGGGGGQMNTSGYHAMQRAQAENARFNIYMDLVSDIPGFFITLIFGKIMDRLGRKPCLIIPLVGIIFRAFIYIIQQVLSLPIEIILITGFTDALSGGFGIFLSAGYAFYADTIPKEKRGQRLAITDVGFGFCIAIVSYAMGYMIQYWGFLYPLFFALGGHFINLTYIIFFVPETRKKTTTWKNVSPRYAIDSFKVFPRKRPNNGQKFLLIFVAAWMVMFFAKSARGLDNLYRLNHPFCWTPVTMGTYSMIRTILMNAAQVFAAIFLFKPLGDMGVLIMGITSNITDDVLTGFAILAHWLLWTVPVTGCLAGIQMPMMRAQMSKLVDPDEQGALFSSLGAVTSILGMGGSAMYNNLYAETLYIYKGIVFFIISAIMIIYLVIIIIFKVLYDKELKRRAAAEESVGDLPKKEESIAKF